MSLWISDTTTRKLRFRLRIFEDKELSFEFGPYKDSPLDIELGCQKVTLAREEAQAARRSLDRYLKATA